MNRFKKSLFTILIIFTLFTASLFASGKQEDDGKLTILATTSMVGDIVSNVAGDFQDIEVLMIRGEDPHTYEPTPRDMIKIENADLIFTNGFGLEETLLEAIENVTSARIVEVSSTIVPIEFEGEDDHDDHEEEEEHHDEDEHHDHENEDDHHHHGEDPHTWTSPLNVIAWTEVIREALTDMDPDNADGYADNAEVYKRELIELDGKARKAFSTIADEDKKLVTDHSVFGYLTNEYEFENFGALVPSFSSMGEASAKDLAELIEEVNEHQIKAVFIGSTAANAMVKLGEVLVEEADHPVELLTLLTGSLTAEGDEGDTYLKYFEYNVNQITKGLGSK